MFTFLDRTYYFTPDVIRIFGLSIKKLHKLAKKIGVRKTPAGYEWTDEKILEAKQVILRDYGRFV